MLLRTLACAFVISLTSLLTGPCLAFLEGCETVAKASTPCAPGKKHFDYTVVSMRNGKYVWTPVYRCCRDSCD